MTDHTHLQYNYPQTYKPFENARNSEHNLWLFCERCGLHASTHYTRDGVENSCLLFDPLMRFERKTNDHLALHYEWCRRCDKHVRHHYGEDKPPRCQPRPVESTAMATFTPKLDYPGICRLCNHVRSAHAHVSGVESCPVMAYEPSTLTPAISSATAAFAADVLKGVANYPIESHVSTAVGGWFGNPVGFGGVVMSSLTSNTPTMSGVLRNTTVDPANPKHYRGDLVMRIIEQFELHESFYLGNVIKYILRHASKAGIEDLKKARWYLDRAIARLEGKHQEGVQ